jgi:hypothetical protein
MKVSEIFPHILLLTILGLMAFSIYPRPFSFRYYEGFCSEIAYSGKYSTVTVSDYVTSSYKTNKMILVIRHDVDLDIQRAIDMSRMEDDYGIRSTYYIRTEGPYKIDAHVVEWLRWLVKEGFDVGYHYEDLYRSGYNETIAMSSFRLNLSLLRSFFVSIYTVTAHGSGDGRPGDLSLNHRSLNLLSLKVLPPISWEDTHKAWDRDLIETIRSARSGSPVYLLIHPDWWFRLFEADFLFGW